MNTSSAEEIKTERDFWISYWEGYQPSFIKNVLFEEIFAKINAKDKDFIEIGGFPGTFCCYFNRNLGANVTLLDYIILPKIVNELESINHLEKGTINLIEADFLTYNSDKEYDIVLSAGFIEHFSNTKHMISQHIKLLKNDGLLFISLPNFLGLNGLIQKRFDPENLAIHYLPSMEIQNLKSICEELGVKNLKIQYYGKPSIWVEKTSKANPLAKKFIKLANKLISFIPIYNKFFSPFILISGSK